MRDAEEVPELARISVRRSFEPDHHSHIPSIIPIIDNLIRQLDRKSQQVESKRACFRVAFLCTGYWHALGFAGRNHERPVFLVEIQQSAPAPSRVPRHPFLPPRDQQSAVEHQPRSCCSTSGLFLGTVHLTLLSTSSLRQQKQGRSSFFQSPRSSRRTTRSNGQAEVLRFRFRRRSITRFGAVH